MSGNGAFCVQRAVCAVREDKPSGSISWSERGRLISFWILSVLCYTVDNTKLSAPVWQILQILNRKVGVLTMSLPKKMDQKTANELRSILTKMNITQSKVKINLDNQTIEVEDDYSIDDILESAGVLTPEQAKQLADEVKKMREEEWN